MQFDDCRIWSLIAGQLCWVGSGPGLPAREGQNHLCSAAVRGRSRFYSDSYIINRMVIELPLQEQICTTGTWPRGHLQNCTTEHILKTINLSLRDRALYS